MTNTFSPNDRVLFNVGGVLKGKGVIVSQMIVWSESLVKPQDLNILTLNGIPSLGPLWIIKIKDCIPELPSPYDAIVLLECFIKLDDSRI